MSARTKRIIPPLIVVFVLVTAVPTFARQIIYVDDDGPADFNNIQAAIDDSNDGDTIIVAEGTYFENINFMSKNIIVRSTDPNDPNVVAVTIIDGNQAGCVVTFAGTEDETCVLAGFTICNGYGTHAGGIRGGHATIRNNIITANTLWHGGAVAYCDGTIQNNTVSRTSILCTGGAFYDCQGTIQNNTIVDNSNVPGLLGCDGLIENNFISGNSTALVNCDGIIQNNTISGNLCEGLGLCNGIIQNNIISNNREGIYRGDEAIIRNNIITGNWAGGLIYCHGEIRNNLIAGNSSSLGGAFHICGGIIENNTIAHNSAYRGGAFYCSGGTIRNCIIWGNTASEGAQFYGSSQPTFSCVQDWTGGGQGNIDADPCFFQPGYSDANGVWVEGNYHLLPDSPCIDAGDPNYVTEPNESDLDGKPRVIGGRIDMGAYEFLHAPEIIYVDVDAPGANNGSSWADAYNYLQDALTAASSGDEIRVAQGIYKPDQEAGITPGDRTATFQLKNGVTIKGGYAGLGERDPDARDIELYETILSGDLAGNDRDVNDLRDLLYDPCRAENSCHVVTGRGTDANAVLDGFTITAGNADLYSQHYRKGAGMYNDRGSPTLSNCTFTSNSAWYGGGMYNNSIPTLTNCTFTRNLAIRGGGMFNSDMSKPVLTSCTFSENIASDDEGSFGGGMYNDNSSPILTNCTFTRNFADVLIPDHGGGEGGGMYNEESSPTLTNCTFSGNTARCHGGGMGNRSKSSPLLKNCIFTGNSAAGSWGRWGYGGGIYNHYQCSPVLINCTFSANSAITGGALYSSYNCSPTLTNCILWDDTPGEINGTSVVNYSDVQGGWPGEGNIDADPCFAESGYWDPNGTPDDLRDDFWVDGDYHLLPTSPCINAGDPNHLFDPNETDLDGRPRIIGGRIDMGAYESRVIYVDDDAAGANDGSSWGNAFNFLQDALAVAYSGDEIWVAQGIYTPDSNSADPNGSANRNATFQLVDGVTLKGGYAGCGEPDPDVRYIALYETILSGDIGTPTDRSDNCYHVFYHPEGLNLDATAIIDGFTITAGNATLRKSPSDRGGGMYNYESSPTVKGCTFIDNHAWPNGGGGMYNSRSNPTVKDCIFRGNFSHVGGGGMYNTSASSPIVDDCIFTTNDIKYNGGGMYNSYDSNPIVTNCTFNANKIHGYGGGMYNLYSSPKIRHCTFSNNRSSDSGGGMYNDRSNTIVENCIFSNNRVTFGNGGGMYNWLGSPKIKGCTFSANSVTYGSGGGMFNRSSPIVEVCTFSANSASDDGGGMYNDRSSTIIDVCTFSANSANNDGGGMYNDGSSPTITNCTFSSNSANNDGGGMYNWYSKPTVTNCILWDDTPGEINGTSVVNYSDVQGGWPGEGNINADPCFAESGYWDPNNTPDDTSDDFWVHGDYHLKSEGWRWDGSRQRWHYDETTSRCIDAGNPSSPLSEEPISLPEDPNNIWAENIRINMGAYGGTPEASMPPYHWALLADMTNDGLVDFRDYAAQADDWLNPGDSLPGDLNRDSVIDIPDLALIAEDWLKATSWHE